MTPLPSATSINENYWLDHRPTIVRILQELQQQKAIVSLCLERGGDFLLSTIVDVDVDKGLLLLEQGVDQEFNQLILAAGKVLCSSTHDQIHIEFNGTMLQSAKFGEEAVFQVAIPKDMLRLQRRQAYRLSISVVNPLTCLIDLPEGRTLEATIVDISIGGIGILAYEGKGLLHTNETYHGCRIELPGAGTYALSLQVCSTMDVTLRNGRTTYRAGCKFIDLPASVETEIQRYINRVERERRKRYI